MRIDQVSLGGLAAYLRRSGAADGDVNLAKADRTGRSAPVGEGALVQVDGLTVLIERQSVLELLPYAAAPVLTVAVEKEMFPDLYADPYAHRVHRVGGFEDFGRGERRRMHVLEVDDAACLVSEGTKQECSWTSPVYRLPAAATFGAAAWDLAASKQATGFAYDLDLRVWPADDPAAPPTVLHMAENADPALPRCIQPLGPKAVDVGAYQLVFRARVETDAPLSGRQGTALRGRSLGRPLLTAVHLLESIPSVHAYHSLQELLDNSTGAKVFDEAQEGPHRPSLFSATIDLSATLGKGEAVVVRVGDDPKILRLEARLLADVLWRPPRTDKED